MEPLALGAVSAPSLPLSLSLGRCRGGAPPREAKRDEEATELRREAEEQRHAADEALAREAARREAAEERLREVEELRKVVAEEQAAELRRHKAAVAELASAQRQLEADLARAAQLAEAADAELRSALERRDELSAETRPQPAVSATARSLPSPPRPQGRCSHDNRGSAGPQPDIVRTNRTMSGPDGQCPEQSDIVRYSGRRPP